MSRLMTKPTKWLCPAKTQNRLGGDQPGHPPSLISLRYPHEESLGPKLPSERTANTLIRLGGCPGWTESLLGASHFVGFVMRWLKFFFLLLLFSKGFFCDSIITYLWAGTHQHLQNYWSNEPHTLTNQGRWWTRMLFYTFCSPPPHVFGLKSAQDQLM